MKRIISIVLVLVLCSTLLPMSFADGIRDQYTVEITSNYWYYYSAWGDSLYVPYLKLNITNEQNTPASKVVVKTVFYNENDKSVFDEQTDYLISSSDTPLRSGYKKTSFIRSNVG